ncbi:MAG: histidinol-phosphate transaminase [Treponema sp.]|jgi:histidinol-phosphate aminotransferase|nr:histidinol-phosphate transaminase [Treponema sp.]
MTDNAESVYWSRLAASLLPYIPGEQPKGRKFIKLNSNENPYPPSPKALEAIRNAANDSLNLYPELSSKGMREAVAARWNVKPEQVFAGNGSDEILAFAFATFFSGRDKNNLKLEPLLLPNVTYSFYPVYARLWNIAFETKALLPDFSINPDDYKQNSGGVIFPNPNAPTGRALSLNVLKEIAGAQEKNKKVFILDEAYIAFADEPGTGSMIPFINDYPNLLVIRTLSKDSSLAGLRVGYAVGSEELIDGLCRIRDSFNSYTIDRVAQAAAAAAISDAAYYNEITAKICRTRERVQSELRAIGFDVIPSQTNFVFASPPLTQHKTAEHFLLALKEKGILVRHFKLPEIENYLRISIGTDEDMDELLRIIKEI